LIHRASSAEVGSAARLTTRRYIHFVLELRRPLWSIVDRSGRLAFLERRTIAIRRF